jgi:chromosome segregation ATPase
MKRTILRATAFFTAAVVVSAIQAQTRPAAPPAEDPAAGVRQCREELKKLRLEVIQQGIEFQNLKIQLLEKEVARAQEDRLRLEAQEQALQEQLAGLSTQPDGPSDEVEGIRRQLSDKGLRGVANKLQPVVQRDTELQAQLTEERKRLRELTARAKQARAEE